MSEAVVVTTGVLVRLFAHKESDQGEVLYDWLLRRARTLGITGGAAYLPVTDGTTDCKSNPFFELTGELQVEVAFAMTGRTLKNFLDALALEAALLFYNKSPCEFGTI